MRGNATLETQTRHARTRQPFLALSFSSYLCCSASLRSVLSLSHELDGLMPDVPPVMHAVEVDLPHRVVRALLSVGDRVAQRGHRQHPPAVGHELAVDHLRAAVEDSHVPHR